MVQEESIVSGLLPMSKRERTRWDIFEMIQHKHLTRREAALDLQLSERHTCRLYKAWFHRGDRAPISRKLGQPGNQHREAGLVAFMASGVPGLVQEFSSTL